MKFTAVGWWRDHLYPLTSCRGGHLAIPSRCSCSFQAMFDWLDNAVIKLCNMSPVGTDLSTVKEQMNEMKVPGRGGTGSVVLLLLTELQ